MRKPTRPYWWLIEGFYLNEQRRYNYEKQSSKHIIVNQKKCLRWWISVFWAPVGLSTFTCYISYSVRYSASKLYAPTLRLFQWNLHNVSCLRFLCFHSNYALKCSFSQTGTFRLNSSCLIVIFFQVSLSKCEILAHSRCYWR